MHFVNPGDEVFTRSSDFTKLLFLRRRDTQGLLIWHTLRVLPTLYSPCLVVRAQSTRVWVDSPRSPELDVPPWPPFGRTPFNEHAMVETAREIIEWEAGSVRTVPRRLSEKDCGA